MEPHASAAPPPSSGATPHRHSATRYHRVARVHGPRTGGPPCRRRRRDIARAGCAGRPVQATSDVYTPPNHHPAAEHHAGPETESKPNSKPLPYAGIDPAPVRDALASACDISHANPYICSHANSHAIRQPNTVTYPHRRAASGGVLPAVGAKRRLHRPRR